MSGTGAAPADELHTSLFPGGFGTPPLGIMTECRELCWKGKEFGKPNGTPRSADPRTETAAVERREASIPITRDAPRLASAVCC